MQYRDQVEKLDCGIFVVQTMHKFFYDKWISLQALKNNVKYSSIGINIFELTNLMKSIGIDSEVLEGDSESFKKIKLDKPIIAIIKNNDFLHYVIVSKFTNKNNVIYIDPIYGKVKKSLDDFVKEFANIIILCQKSNKKTIDEKEINILKIEFIKEQILLVTISLLIIILSFVGTYYLKLMIDQIIPSSNTLNLIIVSFLFLVLSLIKLSFNFVVDYLTFRIEIRYQQIYIKKYISKFSTVKWEKVQHYDESTHLKNIELILQICSFKSKYLFNLISQIICFSLSLIFLLTINLQLFLLSFLSVCILVLITLTFRKKLESIEKISVNNSILFKKDFLNIVNSFDQYKLKSIDKLLNTKFNDSFLTIIKNQTNLKNNYQWYYFLQSVVKIIFPFILIGTSINQIWQGNLSLGQIFIFISIYSFFLNPSFFLVSLLIERSKIINYLENINSFFLIDEEQEIKTTKVISKIQSITLKNINFNYLNSDNKLKVKKLNIDSNLRLVGQNGVGKSTLMKIIATLVNDQEIYFNNNHLLHYEINSIRKQICFIQQNDYLPNSTIYNYLISTNDNDPTILLNNIDKYNLLDLFNFMNLNLSTTIEDNGKNLSLGQKQFIFIMKLFAFEYSLVLLDEVFENINAIQLEKIIHILSKHLKNKIVIEISHQSNYIFNSKEINCEEYR